MDYAFICDRYPRLEYLFGCYLPRFPRVEPDCIVRRFALNKPAVLPYTTQQLENFLQFVDRQPNPENTCQTLLTVLGCPIYHAIRQYSALAWLQHVLRILWQYSTPSDYHRLKTSVASEYESLDEPIVPDRSLDLVLDLPYIILRGYRLLLKADLAVDRVASLTHTSPISETPVALMSADNTWFATNQGWTAAEILLDVPFFV